MTDIKTVQLRKRLLIPMFVIFVVALGLIIITQKQSPSERICDNLIDAGYLSSPDECLITDYTPDYMEAYFPKGKVDVAYVRAGMKGFEMYKEIYPTNCGDWNTCVRLDYVIESRLFLIGDETYELIFGDDILVNTLWHD